MIALSSAVLFGISTFVVKEYIDKINNKINRFSKLKKLRNGKIIAAILVLVVLISNYSFFTGGVEPFYNYDSQSYYQAANWLDSQNWEL